MPHTSAIRRRQDATTPLSVSCKDRASAARAISRFSCCSRGSVSAVEVSRLDIDVVTIDLALAWALEPDVPTGSVVRPMRLLVVRGFTRYMTGIDPRAEIPPTGLIPFRQRRLPPFIYSDAEISR